MFLSLYKYLFLSITLFLLSACGNDSGSTTEPEPTVPEAMLTDVVIEGGQLRQDFSVDGEAYIVDVASYVSSIALTLDIEHETEASIAAVLSVDPESTDDDLALSIEDGVLDFQLPILSDVTVTVTFTQEDFPERSYSFTFERPEEISLEQVVNIASLAGFEFSDGDRFGSSVDYDGKRVAVGVDRYDGQDAEGNAITDSGAVAVFEQDDQGAWSYTLIQAPNASANNQYFGSSVAIKDDILVASMPYDNGDADATLGNYNENFFGAGAVFVFIRNPESAAWEAMHYVRSETVVSDEYFGTGFTLWVDEVTGATQLAMLVHDSSNGSSIEVFERNYVAADEDEEASDIFEHVSTLTGIYIQGNIFSSNALKLNDDFLVYGQAGEDYAGGNTADFGRVAVFPRRADGTFHTEDIQYIEHTPTVSVTGRRLGYAVSLYENRLAIGAPGDGVGGMVHTYTYTADTDDDGDADAWEFEESIEGSNTIAGDDFGISVHLIENLLAVGARGNDGDASTTEDTVIDLAAADHVDDSGGIYTFVARERSEDTTTPLWVQDWYQKASDASANDGFGEYVFIGADGSILGSALGGEADSADQGADAGSWYLFQ